MAIQLRSLFWSGRIIAVPGLILPVPAQSRYLLVTPCLTLATNMQAELDRFCNAMIAIREEIKDIEEGRAEKYVHFAVKLPRQQCLARRGLMLARAAVYTLHCFTMLEILLACAGARVCSKSFCLEAAFMPSSCLQML